MALEVFLKIDGVKGESQVEGHMEEIQVLNWNWGVSQSHTLHTGSGGGAGKANFRDLHFTHNMDTASPALAQLCAGGRHIPKIVLHMRKAGDADGKKALPFYKVELEDCIISNVEFDVTANSTEVVEQVTIGYAKIKSEYQAQDKTGGKKGAPVKMGWDVQQNKTLN